MQNDQLQETRLVELNNELINRIKILRLREDVKDGFQRNLKGARVSNLVNALKKTPSLSIPPILIGEVDGELILIDGQHRFEARKRFPYRLFAQISKMNMQDAVHNFVKINGTSVRVSLTHRLEIDTAKNAKTIRQIALKYGMQNNHVFHMISELKGRHFLWNDDVDIDKLEIEFVERILNNWTKDKRWKSAAQCYAKPAILKAITRICTKSKNMERTLDIIKGMNFTSVGKLYEIQGLTGQRQKAIIQKMNAHIVQNMN